ncbi:hypothetical protein N7526_009544 [Penicillium atrosanguineum]|nr:hypothetical protein N7526_009544 [Penicillium atrosanguineum]
MGSPDLDQDISPVPRSREENQERAFIAASRRKDRSLDARLESANRASMLHKKRTGKAFHITKDIVEKEAMYEEVDERYQEKRIRMLQAQNMQIEEQFHRHLLAAFAARASSSSASSIASRRSSMAPRASIDGGNSRKMSLDLSNLRTPFPQEMDTSSLSSPMTTGTEAYAMSPATNFDHNSQSYMQCIDGSDASSAYSGMMTSAPAAQIPAYVTQRQTPGPNWPTQMTPSWAMQQQVPTPSQTPTDATAVHMWQQQMMQQAQMPADAAAAPAPAASISGPSGGGHSRGKSQPSNNIHRLNLLTQGTHLAQMVPSGNSSPKVEVFSAATQSTPDFCLTPNTPLSPTAVGTVQADLSYKPEGDGIMVSHEELDADFNEFSQFALGLGNSSLQERDFNGFDDFVHLDEYGSVSC